MLTRLLQDRFKRKNLDAQKKMQLVFVQMMKKNTVKLNWVCVSSVLQAIYVHLKTDLFAILQGNVFPVVKIRIPALMKMTSV